jgi:hypothetical protein
MERKKKYLVPWAAALTAIAAALVLGVPAPAAGGAGVTPESPDVSQMPKSSAEAKRLASTGAAFGAGAVHEITPAEAFALSKQPGAVTEIAPGLTPAQAFGLDSAASTGATSPLAAEATLGQYVCWSDYQYPPHVTWGTYPLQQTVYDHQSWCAYYGRFITSRTQYVSLGSTFCSHHDPYGYRLSGGVGYSWVSTRAGGSFGCPTGFPWLINNRDDSFDMARNAWGTEALLATHP